MQIWRAKDNYDLVLGKEMSSDKYFIDKTRLHKYRIGDIHLRKGKAYAVYDYDPFSGGYYEVSVPAGEYRLVYVVMDVTELYKYFTIDLEATMLISTTK